MASLWTCVRPELDPGAMLAIGTAPPVDSVPPLSVTSQPHSGFAPAGAGAGVVHAHVARELARGGVEREVLQRRVNGLDTGCIAPVQPVTSTRRVAVRPGRVEHPLSVIVGEVRPRHRADKVLQLLGRVPGSAARDAGELAAFERRVCLGDAQGVASRSVALQRHVRRYRREAAAAARDGRHEQPGGVVVRPRDARAVLNHGRDGVLHGLQVQPAATAATAPPRRADVGVEQRGDRGAGGGGGGQRPRGSFAATPDARRSRP